MDVPDVAVGNIIYLPVNKDGAYLYLGDCHAAQGDGELCGVAIEHPTVTEIQVDLIKNWEIVNPRVESEKFFMSIGSGRPMEDAVRRAYRDLVFWMEKDWGYDKLEAYFLLTQCGKVRLGNMVDPKYSMGASIDKETLLKGLDN